MSMSGEELKREGMARASVSNPGMAARVVGVAQEFPEGWEGLFEVIRKNCESRGIVPNTDKFWGAATSACIRAGVLAKTGRTAKPVDPASHRCEKAVYQRVGAF